MDMIELLLLENELHKSLNAPGAMKDEKNASLTLAKILEVQSKLKDMQEQYDCFWGKYEQKNAELIKRAKTAADETGGSTLGEIEVYSHDGKLLKTYEGKLDIFR
ncbi:hypothetical protein P4H32_32365 [Bacillus cereus]|nr:hypothetical protein [Bacillus cereus]